MCVVDMVWCVMPASYSMIQHGYIPRGGGEVEVLTQDFSFPVENETGCTQK
jgi:RNA 3'-terminal phosphate cyclase